jgi:hypothetical protein
VFDDLSESIESEGGMFVRRDKNEYYLVFIVRTDCASHQWLDVLSVRLCVRANRIRTRTGRLCVRANRGKHAAHPLGAVRDRCSWAGTTPSTPRALDDDDIGEGAQVAISASSSF